MSELLVQYTAPICCLQTKEVNTKNFMQILFDPRLELEDAQQHSPSPPSSFLELSLCHHHRHHLSHLLS